MKIIITQQEAMQKGVWSEVAQMFGVQKEDETWANEQYILTEEQARQLGFIS
ncbi:hypothetical protein J2Z69_002971 [Paenibacillus shirakamiensis]|uniref:Uncharacterized protein n=1 Tax=Paenibacillus shirakamiensis TaxID=1265935 RepID=A0ABS4JJN0_9BACL|nr:hypothetical protein [Paenibacillus shirakamiensis]MBP2001915.1 hypothetical protein [Paenibacillus shirakamiensis]